MRKGTVWLAMLLACALLAGVALAEMDLSQARIEIENHEQNDSNVALPKLVGHPDPIIQGRINDQMRAKLDMDDAMIILARAKTWGADGEGIHMSDSSFLNGRVLSVVVSTQGELPGGEFGQRYATFNYDLETGMPFVLGDLFTDVEQAVQAMEEMMSTALADNPLNPYLEYRDILPMPRDSFALCDKGLVVYYPNTQYALLTGEGGTHLFYYYQLEPYLKADSPLIAPLLAQTKTDDPARQLREDIAAGTLPGVPVKLGMSLEKDAGAYRPMDDPDHTTTSELYLFADPLMQDVSLECPLYADGVEPPDPVQAIRAAHIDLYGIRPGHSTLDDVSALLGQPDGYDTVDQQRAQDDLMTPGDSYLYEAGDNQLVLHADQTGTIVQMILRKKLQ